MCISVCVGCLMLSHMLMHSYKQNEHVARMRVCTCLCTFGAVVPFESDAFSSLFVQVGSLSLSVYVNVQVRDRECTFLLKGENFF